MSTVAADLREERRRLSWRGLRARVLMQRAYELVYHSSLTRGGAAEPHGKALSRATIEVAVAKAVAASTESANAAAAGASWRPPVVRLQRSAPNLASSAPAASTATSSELYASQALSADEIFSPARREPGSADDRELPHVARNSSSPPSTIATGAFGAAGAAAARTRADSAAAAPVPAVP